MTRGVKRSGEYPRDPCPECGRLLLRGVLERHRISQHGDGRLTLYVPLDEQQRIVELYRSGLSTQAVGDLVHWSSSTVCRVLALWGVPARYHFGSRPRHDPVQLLEIARLYGMGYSLKAVGEMVGLHPEAVRQRLVRGGIKRRSCGPPSPVHARARRSSPPVSRAA